MSILNRIDVGEFFGKFIKECEDYDEVEHIFQFENVTLTHEFLLLSGLEDKEYITVSFDLDDSEVVVSEKSDGEEKVVFSSLIQCSLYM